MSIRIRKRLDSETIHLPELRHLIGKWVDITVEEENADRETPTPPGVTPHPLSKQATDEFWTPPSLEEIARRQGNTQPVSFDDLLGSFTEEDFEGFDEWLDEQRGHNTQPGKPK